MNVEQKEWLQESLKLIYIEHHASSVFELIYSPDRLCSSLASVLYEGMEVGKGGLIESWAWRHDKDTVLNFSEAKKVLSEYTKYRPLTNVEEIHLFDVYKLSILFDCVWYFERGDVMIDFFEKRKFDFLDHLGREVFYQVLYDRKM
jgi:hypothetical protein